MFVSTSLLSPVEFENLCHRHCSARRKIQKSATRTAELAAEGIR
jgi:hypothetical protein